MKPTEKLAMESMHEPNPYQWILFDADDTLFDFNSFLGLQSVFKEFDITFTQDNFVQYQKNNSDLWTQFQNNEITAQELGEKRFISWALKLDKNASDLNTLFLNRMAEISNPLEGAIELLSFLREKVKIGLITNGFSLVQEKRLKRLGLENHFSIIVVSEHVGFAKPHRGIFDYALNVMGNPHPNQVLMIGDNLESDIVGAKNAGFKTAWLNAHNKTISGNYLPDYQFSSLDEIKKWLSPIYSVVEIA